MLKNIGFDRDISSTDIKTFCSLHYSKSSSAYMPVIKCVPTKDDSSNQNQQESQSSESGSGSQGGQSSNGGDKSSQSQNKILFDARTTALFKDGYKVGELSDDLTLVFNAFGSAFNGTTLSIDNVPYGQEKANVSF